MEGGPGLNHDNIGPQSKQISHPKLITKNSTFITGIMQVFNKINFFPVPIGLNMALVLVMVPTSFRPLL